jgi:hypothetical protein
MIFSPSLLFSPLREKLVKQKLGKSYLMLYALPITLETVFYTSLEPPKFGFIFAVCSLFLAIAKNSLLKTPIFG